MPPLPTREVSHPEANVTLNYLILIRFLILQPFVKVAVPSRRVVRNLDHRMLVLLTQLSYKETWQRVLQVLVHQLLLPGSWQLQVPEEFHRLIWREIPELAKVEETHLSFAECVLYSRGVFFIYYLSKLHACASTQWNETITIVRQLSLFCAVQYFIHSS